MREFAAFVARRGAVRVALTGMVAIWVAGCADSDRFDQSYAPSADPFSNPFASNSGPSAAPTPSVASAPLAAPGAVQTASIPPASAPAAPAPAYHVASNQPVGGSAAGWSIVGGSPIVVAQGDDADSLSRRYGVPTTALTRSNGLSSPSEIHSGMHLVIPVYNAGAESVGAKSKKVAAAEDADVAPVKHAKAKDKAETADASSKVKAKEKTAGEEKLSAKSEDKKSDKSGEKPEAKTAATKVEAKEAKNEPDSGTTKAKKSQPDVTPTASVKAADATAPMTAAEADAAGVTPEFRWPARGRIIEGFKAGGNDGINIAVPEGTSVRAAESGVVAYAGNELKGYGNLVLIRHPNGFVSAYANNGELDVKRGDTVKRGQVIAKSGQTGNVNSPQLHFELRKGSTPVDPTSYLAGL
jgi:murein DD-endopeptidase MepM/ murein hydrolase activator NlpD